MNLFIHYQERIIQWGGPRFSPILPNRRKETLELLTDVLMPMDEFFTMYGDDLQIEHFLNSVGKWDDNGVTENDQPLEARIKYVVSGTNLLDYAQRHKLKIIA